MDAELESALSAPGPIRELRLERKGLRRLPPEIGRLSALESLSLEGNLLTDLPKELASLPLSVLNLRRNRFVRLPPLMAKMTSLTRLDLGVNQLRELPSLEGLTRLTSLELGPNPPLRRPPDWLWSMKGLTRLSLFRIPLAAIPPELSRLTSLTELELGEPGDLLEHDRPIPPAVFSLPRLQRLTVFGSSINELPPEIVHLKELEELSLIETRLTNLPLPALQSLPRLKVVTLSESRLSAAQLAALRQALPACRIEA